MGRGNTGAMVTYLFPKHLRVGSSSLVAIDKDHVGCWIVVFHGDMKITKKTRGYRTAYARATYTRISEDLYNHLKLEAHENRQLYKLKSVGRVKSCNCNDKCDCIVNGYLAGAA